MTELHDDNKPDHISHKTWIMGCRLFIKRWFELTLVALDKDLRRIDDLDAFQQLYLRGKWAREIDLLMHIHKTLQRYETDRGKLELVAQEFGEQLGLPSGSMPIDVQQRLEWYK